MSGFCDASGVVVCKFPWKENSLISSHFGDNFYFFGASLFIAGSTRLIVWINPNCLRTACFDRSSGWPWVNPRKSEGARADKLKKMARFLFEVFRSQQRRPMGDRCAPSVESTEGILEIRCREPFSRWGFLRFRVRVRFNYGWEFTRSSSETPLCSNSGFDGWEVVSNY